MTSFSEVLDLAKVASDALNALDESSKSKVLSLFGKYENGLTALPLLAKELRAHARVGFVTAGSIAVEHVKDLVRESGLPSVDLPVILTSPVLERAVSDLAKNFAVFDKSQKTDTDLRRLRFRTVLSVQTALRRGFTDNQLAAAGVLRAQGATLKKVWLANFTNNTPCITCSVLHGTELDVGAEFSHGGAKAPSTFEGLMGPPRHPNCHCYMLIYVVSLDTIAVIPQAPALEEHKFMSSKDVKRLPRAVFTAAVTTLRLIAGKLRSAIRGKR